MYMCAIDGCDRPIDRRGWCTRHYTRWYRHGDPLAGRAQYATPAESFAARTEERGGCLVWTGGTNGTYGVISAGGGREEYVHRWAWEQENGPVPDGMLVDHRCRNVLCARVDHLRLATRKQNAEHLAGAYSNSASGVRGVCWEASRGKWRAYAGRTFVGRYDDPEDAAEAAREARLRLFTHNDHDRLISES